MLEDPDDLVQIEQLHDPDLELVISLFDDLRHLLVRQDGGQEHDVAVAGFFQGIGQVNGVGIFHQLQDSLFIFSVQGGNQFVLYPFFQFFLFFFYRMVLFLFIHAEHSPLMGPRPPRGLYGGKGRPSPVSVPPLLLPRQSHVVRREPSNGTVKADA